MPVKLPYMVASGVIPKMLIKIQEAKRPERFTQDYLETMLGFRGGNNRAFLPLLKRMGFLSSDGTPTDLYDKYRNEDSRAVALAQGVRNAYSEVFDRNQFAFNLPRDKFASLITEMTGQAKASPIAKLVVSTFFTLKDGADFEGKLEDGIDKSVATDKSGTPAVIDQANVNPPPPPAPPPPPPPPANQDDVQFRVGYTINLNLPETTNPDVFNAIFKSLKEHLLRN